MYLFRQFWRFLWLADFFQNCTVSRASVNGDLQNGPPLAQSFATELAIESGLYIAPGRQLFGSGQQFRHFGSDLPGLLRTCQICAKCRNLSDQDFRTSAPEERFWRQSPEIPKSCEILEILEILQNPGNLRNPDFSRKVAISEISKISGSDRFPDNRCYQILTFESMCTLMSETASDLMCTARSNAHPHIDTMHIVSECILAHGINLVDLCTIWSIVRFENNFWNK